MKSRTSVVLAALALAVFGVACDKNGPPPGNGASFDQSALNQTFAGSSFTIDVDDQTGESTTLHNLIATGGPSGNANIDALLIFKTHAEKIEKSHDNCPPEYPHGAELVSLTWVETYKDGSLFTAQATPKGSVVCTDGNVFYAKIKGKITGGTKRFEGAKGTWEATATVTNSRMTGDLTATIK